MTPEEFLKELEENDKLVGLDKSTDIENMLDFSDFAKKTKCKVKEDESDDK